ncbi:MAG: hypothetical protein M3436_18555 [Pseudomonadota bacterium]|nr:hypothetical protein [Pseudomonadota bacterium]
MALFVEVAQIECIVLDLALSLAGMNPVFGLEFDADDDGAREEHGIYTFLPPRNSILEQHGPC